jgi:ABC-2 type transport system ATP-binding protein
LSVLSFDGVVKRFGDFVAVDQLSFAVPEGAVFGFLGGNGAGKTTSIRMALDILRATSGRIEILGRAPSRERASEIGFLPEERGLYRKMTVLDTVVYFGRLKGLAQREARKSAMALIERFELGDWAGQRLEKLSKGMSQKVQVATALVNAPRMLLLDEPFSGLDPVNQAMLEDVILEQARGGATVVFSCSTPSGCATGWLIARGKKVFERTQEEARATLPQRLTVSCRADPGVLPGVESAVLQGESKDGWTDWSLSLKSGAQAGELLQACTANGFVLRSFDIHKPSFHDVFIHLVGAGAEVVR